ncbi:MAG: flagellar protein FlgN [Clostridia bacterium]|nr:flagellar protein FlgN [Clostridia bacterium]
MDIQILNELISVLEQEIKVYESILQIARNKTSIIIEGKVAELENIVKIEQSLVLQMGRLENIRENLVEKISTNIGINSSDLTISELVNHVKGNEVQKLVTCQDSLNNIITDIKNTNEVNSKLIKNSLDYIDFSLNVMTNIGTTSNNYGSTGESGDSKKRSFFDVKL